MNIQNIYVLDINPLMCARYCTDITISAMLPELAQILSCTHSDLDGEVAARARIPGLLPGGLAGMNGRWRHWARQCIGNYSWLHMLMDAAVTQFHLRYKRVHAYYGTVASLYHAPMHIASGVKHPFPRQQNCESVDDYAQRQRWLYVQTCGRNAQWSAPATKPDWWDHTCATVTPLRAV